MLVERVGVRLERDDPLVDEGANAPPEVVDLGREREIDGAPRALRADRLVEALTVRRVRATILGCAVKAPRRSAAACGTRRSAIHLGDLWPGEGGRSAPRLTGVRGYHPLLAVAAGSPGCATAAAHVLRRDDRPGPRCRSERTTDDAGRAVEAGRPDHDPPAAEHAPARGGLEYWLAGGADVAETTYTPFASRTPRRCRKPTPGSQLALFTVHHRDARTRGRPSSPRRDRERDP